MTDQGRASPGTDPEDGFERELRTLLRDRASGPIPGSLPSAVDDALTGRPRGRIGLSGLRRAAMALGAVVAAVVLLGASFNPISMIIEAVRPPASSPGVGAPGSPRPTPARATVLASLAPRPSGSRTLATDTPLVPGPAAYNWSTPMVALTADDIDITAAGHRIDAPPMLRGRNDPGDQRYRTLELSWIAEGREQRLSLYFTADATHWWVSELRTYDDQSPEPHWITYPGPLFRTPIGEAFHGDVSLGSTNGSVAGTVGMTNATIDPSGLGTGPVAYAGCTPWSNVDSATRAQLDSALEVTRVAAIADALGLCVLYRWTYRVADGGAFGETWCTPPPAGTVRLMTAGDAGELLVFVDDETVREPRPQPPSGWGCDANPEMSTGAPTLEPARPTPTPAAIAASTFDWTSDQVALTAADVRIVTGGNDGWMTHVIRVPTRPDVSVDLLDPTGQSLALAWRSEGSGVRLTLRLDHDDTSWWVSTIELIDSELLDDPIVFTGPFLTTPIGLAFAGNATLAADPTAPVRATIELADLRLAPMGPRGSAIPRPGSPPEVSP